MTVMASKGCPEHLSQAAGKNNGVIGWHRVGLPWRPLRPFR